MTNAKIRIDFMVLGTQKGGTTTLHDMLASHPEIALPIHKETHFFSHADRYQRGEAWYRAQFRVNGKTKLIGEVDPEYMFSPYAAERISEQTTARKFIFVLRHPLMRAYSHYLMTRLRGREPLNFAAALSSEKKRLEGEQALFAYDNWTYSGRSLYSAQIRNFQRVFPDAKFLYLLSDDLKRIDEGSAYLGACAMIGAEPRAACTVARTRSNVAAAPRSEALRNLIYAPDGKSKLRQWVMNTVPAAPKAAVFRLLDRLNRKQVETDPREALRTVPVEILQAMAEDLEKTEELTGLDLAGWRHDLAARLMPKAEIDL